MSLLCRFRLMLALGLAAVSLMSARAADDPKEGQKVKKDATVTFRTVDSVDLKGTLWTPTNKKNACVLLLHDFNRKTGGNRNDDGWNDLAEELAKEGYTVLSFDFRGHGDSTTVSKEFWDKTKYPANQALLRGKVIIKVDDYPSKIDYKAFPTTGSYYLHLVDDIAAAKEYLDSKVGSASGNTIVIGAGEGATLGALWMTSEYRRYREKMENVMPRVVPTIQGIESDPEGKDLVCGIWLSLNGNIDNKPQTQLSNWLEEVGGKRNKIPVPMLFLYGKDGNVQTKLTARSALTRMIPGYQMMEGAEGLNKDPNHKYTRDLAIDSKLEGSQLLQKGLDTTKFIKVYVNQVVEERGNVERKRHEPEKFRYFWITPGTFRPSLAKISGEQFMMPIPVTTMGAR